MKFLKDDIKKGTYKSVYLLYGEEHFLIKHYEGELKSNIIPEGSETMNLSLFQGKDAVADSIIDASETMPFFNEYRLVLAKDTGFFALGRKEESDKIASYISDVPESTIIVFIENDIDKRNSLYKAVSKMGRAVEFKTPGEKDLLDWIIKYCKKRGKTIERPTAITLLQTVLNDMATIASEMDKLTAYVGNDVITAEDISLVCNKSVESKIFDLVGAIGNKKAHIALDVFANLLHMKESPIMVLSMIARQFRIILQCKDLSHNNMPVDKISEKLGIRSFIARDCLKQAKNFETETLLKAYEKCLKADVGIKTGRIDAKLAVELLILSI